MNISYFGYFSKWKAIYLKRCKNVLKVVDIGKRDIGIVPVWRKEIFYLQLYGVRHMVKDHSESERGNLLLPHRLLFSINSKGYFICTDRIAHTTASHGALAGMRNSSVVPPHEGLISWPIVPWANALSMELLPVWRSRNINYFSKWKAIYLKRYENVLKVVDISKCHIGMVPVWRSMNIKYFLYISLVFHIKKRLHFFLISNFKAIWI